MSKPRDPRLRRLKEAQQAKRDERFGEMVNTTLSDRMPQAFWDTLAEMNERTKKGEMNDA